MQYCKVEVENSAKPSHFPYKIVRNCAKAITELQRLSFVGSTSEACNRYPLLNLQNLGAIPK